MGRGCTQICTLENFLAQTKKIGVHVLGCLQHEQKIGSFIYLFIYLIQQFSHMFTKQRLIVSGITSFITVFYIFRNNSLHFICSPICSLFFGFACHFPKVNLVFIVAFDQEHFHQSKPVYLLFTRRFQPQPVSCTV